MSNSEKWTWWNLGVVAATIAAYAAFRAFVGHGPASTSVFALFALTALPAFNRDRVLDERDLGIANKALRAGLSAFYLAFIGLFLTIGFTRGWDATLTVPVWTLGEVLGWAAYLVLGVKAVTTIVLYRGGSHA